MEDEDETMDKVDELPENTKQQIWNDQTQPLG